MKSKSLGSFPSFDLPASQPNQPVANSSSKRRFGRKLYVMVAAIAIIVIVVAAVLIVPQGNANILPLAVKYNVGEKLTYEVVSSSTSSLIANTTTTVTGKSALTIEVLSFDGETYTLNYTSTTSIGDFTTTTSHVATVKASDMITFFSLLPVALQSFATSGTATSNNPVMSASFNQTEAKVGDTWTFPLTSSDNNSATTGQATVTFKGIQNLSVKAGTFKVFRIDLTQNSEESQNAPFVTGYYKSGTDFVGQTYLQYGTCKQVESTFQMNLTSQTGPTHSFDISMSATSTLTQDAQP